MPAQCSKGKGMSEALSPARVQNQKGLAAVVNLQRGKKEKKKKKKKKGFRLKINPLHSFSRKYDVLA